MMAFKLIFFTSVLFVLILQCFGVFAKGSLISSPPPSASSAPRFRKFRKKLPLKKHKLLNSRYIGDLTKTTHEKLNTKLSRGNRYDDTFTGNFRPLDGVISTLVPLSGKLLRRKNGSFRPLKKLGNKRSLNGKLGNLQPLKPSIRNKLRAIRIFSRKSKNLPLKKTISQSRRLLANRINTSKLNKLKQNGNGMTGNNGLDTSGKLKKKGLKAILRKNEIADKSSRFFRKGGSKVSKSALGERLSNFKPGGIFNENGLSSEKFKIFKNLKSVGLFKKRGVKKLRFSLEEGSPTTETRKGLFGRLGQKPLLRLGRLRTGGANSLGNLNLNANTERKQRFGQIAAQLSDPQTIQAVANLLTAGMTMMAGGVPGGYRNANDSSASATKPAHQLPSLTSNLVLRGRLFGRRLFGKSFLTLKRNSAVKKINKAVFDGAKSKSVVKHIAGSTKATRKSK